MQRVWGAWNILEIETGGLQGTRETREGVVEAKIKEEKKEGRGASSPELLSGLASWKGSGQCRVLSEEEANDWGDTGLIG